MESRPNCHSQPACDIKINTAKRTPTREHPPTHTHTINTPHRRTTSTRFALIRSVSRFAFGENGSTSLALGVCLRATMLFRTRFLGKLEKDDEGAWRKRLLPAAHTGRIRFRLPLSIFNGKLEPYFIFARFINIRAQALPALSALLSIIFPTFLTSFFIKPSQSIRWHAAVL